MPENLLPTNLPALWIEGIWDARLYVRKIQRKGLQTLFFRARLGIGFGFGFGIGLVCTSLIKTPI